jgi:AraC-like DNA-binding protein
MAAREKLELGISVKRAALESGFWHLSGFARGYRNLVGELPSASRDRTGRGQTPVSKFDRAP